MIRYAGKPFVVHRVDSIFSELTVDEWEEASILGIRRSAESERENLRQRYGATRDLFHEISSMHAEKAFHVITGGKWHQYDRDNETDLHNLKRHDVDRYQVRQDAGGRNSSLIVRANDNDADVFVLVLGWHRLYEIVGWMTAKEAKQKKYLCAPDPSRPSAWMVPNRDLHPIREVPDFPQGTTDRFVSKETHAIVRMAFPKRSEHYIE